MNDDSSIPQAITSIFIIISGIIGICVVIAGTITAYNKAEQKIQAKIATKNKNNTSLELNVNVNRSINNNDEKTNDMSNNHNERLVSTTQPHMEQAMHDQSTIKQHRGTLICKLIQYIPREIWNKKRCYFGSITHIIDQATDIAVIYEFYLIYDFESSSKENNCPNINGLSLFVLSLGSFLLYRIISSIWVFFITKSLFHTLLQLLDLKLYHAMYINFAADKVEPNSPQRYIHILEASLG